MTAAVVIVLVLLFLVVLFLISAIKVAREYERGIIFRLGRLLPEPKGPGLFILIPIVDRMVKVDLRTITLNIPPQEVITKDNVPVRVNAVAYFRIVEPKNAIVQIENFMVATSQIAQTTLRSVLGQHLLDELLSERDKINAILQEIIDEATSPWGIKVSIVEVKDVEIPSGMQRAMARQAEAERERRAKVIDAEGEFQASERLKDAALVIEHHPIALQLRYLQTLIEIGTSHVDDDRLPGADRHADAVPREAQELLTDLRVDPLSGRLVAIAPGRAAPAGRRGRAASRGTGELESCPFCEGREDRTPPEMFALPAEGREPTRRLAGPRRAQPVPGLRAPGGGRPLAAPRALVRGARRRGARPRGGGVAAARRGRAPAATCTRCVNEGRAAGREPAALPLAARLARASRRRRQAEHAGGLRHLGAGARAEPRRRRARTGSSPLPLCGRLPYETARSRRSSASALRDERCSAALRLLATRSAACARPRAPVP